jgi:hypothetical protein
MRRRLALLLPLPVLGLFAACTTTPALPDCTPVGSTGQICLLAPGALPAVNASHLVDITHDGQKDSFMGLLQIDEHTLRLAGFSLFGTSLFTIEYDGHSIRSRPEQMAWHPDLLVVMLELSAADPTALEARLHNLTLKTSDADHKQVRELFEHGHLIARIERTDAPLAQAHIHIEIPLANVVVEMTPIAGAVSPP